ncbi:thioesterase domain-containing protein [Nocardioides baculatus]|uniref:ATP-grasp domain-containing protein n=1 Tax=Nocardioides baculatus TaxID=2801337 RepID=A0ABS1L9Z6_9ACTN|nr:thioesterase domain-containing protein [Nocardioides baculatus]MBL0748518.1 ATP-grasp domain-containing protein [Nocardioides baculatus]
MKVTGVRRGGGPVLHLFAGAGGDADELSALVAALAGDPTVVAHVPVRGAAAVGSVGAMATTAAAHVRATQPTGPYRLIGYSFGGLVALEVGRLLREDRHEVELVGLVDTFFDQRFWPASLFVRASARRTSVHLRSALAGPPGVAAREVGDRAVRLGARVVRRVRPTPSARAADAGELSVQDANVAVMAQWEPHTFAGPTTLFTASDADFGCDLDELWRPWLPDLAVRRVAADHRTLLSSPASVAQLADEIDAALGTAPRPLRVLVATTFGWPGAARLAEQLVATGCTVQAVAPRTSPVHGLGSLERVHRLSLTAPLRSLAAAVEASRPDLVVPFDDRTRQALERARTAADPGTAAGSRLRAVLDRSLGAPGDVGSVYSRARLMEVAAAAGIPCPETVVVRSESEVEDWFATHPGPGVLKTDGSWGGRGVTMAPGVSEARRAWRTMSRPPPLHRALKRLVAERDPWALRALLLGARPVVSIQPMVEGRPANSAVACHEGTVLAAVHVEVLESVGPTGPATRVRLVEHADMTYAAKSVVAALRLSGLCGLDFVVDRAGTAHLLELNPRATPTAHLVGADGADPLSALRAALGHELPLQRESPRPGDLVVSLTSPAPTDAPAARRRTHFWLPSPRLPRVATSIGEGDGSTVVTTRGSS